MFVLKHLLKNGKGTGKITFSPEALAYINQLIDSPYLVGMNTPTSYKQEGIQALQYLKAKAEKEKEELLNNPTSEFRYRLVRKATPEEIIKGKKDEYIKVLHGIGMSGADPLAEFFVGGVALRPLLWLGKGMRYASSKVNPKWFKNLDFNFDPDIFSEFNFGTRKSFSNLYLKTSFNKDKEGVWTYVLSPEFKRRVMNTGEFTESEYLLLLREIRDRLNKTDFVGPKMEEGARTITNNKTFHSYVSIYPKTSEVLLKANNWHEIFHTLGGVTENDMETPMLFKLRSFNQNINPSSRRLSFAYHPWYERNIYTRPREVRSRMEAVLQRFRDLGYDTNELIDNPNKFIEWANEIGTKTKMPWDYTHLLQAYDIKDLANYASKILSGAGVFYIGNETLNNKTENKLLK